MTARLLHDKDLTALLCRRCYGETIFELARAYDITEFQVSNIFVTHRETYKKMKVFLGRVPAGQGYVRRIFNDGVWRNCVNVKSDENLSTFWKCDREFWTFSPDVESCTRCDEDIDRQTRKDHTATAWRGLG